MGNEWNRYHESEVNLEDTLTGEQVPGLKELLASTSIISAKQTRQEPPVADTVIEDSEHIRSIVENVMKETGGYGETLILSGQEKSMDFTRTMILPGAQHQEIQEITEEQRKAQEEEEAQKKAKKAQEKEYQQAIERIELYTTFADKLSEAHKGLVRIEQDFPGEYPQIHAILERIEQALVKSISTRPEDLLPVAAELLPVGDYYLRVGQAEAEYTEEEMMKELEKHFWKRVTELKSFHSAFKEVKNGGIGGAAIDALAKIEPVFETVAKKITGGKETEEMSSMGGRIREFLRGGGLTQFAQNQMRFIAKIEEEFRVLELITEKAKHPETLGEIDIQEYLHVIYDFHFMHAADELRIRGLVAAFHMELGNRGQRKQEALKREDEEPQQEENTPTIIPATPQTLIENIREKIKNLPMKKVVVGSALSLATLLTLTTSNLVDSYAEQTEQEGQETKVSTTLPTPTVSAAPKPQSSALIVEAAPEKPTISQRVQNIATQASPKKESIDEERPQVQKNTQSVVSDGAEIKKPGFLSAVKKWWKGTKEEQSVKRIPTNTEEAPQVKKVVAPAAASTPLATPTVQKHTEEKKSSLFSRAKSAFFGKKPGEVKHAVQNTYKPSTFKGVGHVAPLTEIKDGKTGKSTFFGYLMAGEKEMQKAMESIKAEFPRMTSLTPKAFVDGQEAGVGVFTADKNIQFQLHTTEGKTMSYAFEVVTADGNVHYVQAGEASWKVSKTYVKSS